MKLYSICTGGYNALRDNFLQTLEDDWEINIEPFEMKGDGKIAYLREKITGNWGDIILWADVDIQFFGSCSHAIQQAIAGKDIVFQAQRWPEKEVNTGFVAIRCNERTLGLYNSLLGSDPESSKNSEQSAMNNVLGRKSLDISWDVFPPQFWAMSHYMYNQAMPRNDMVLHHANCISPVTVNGKTMDIVELKLQQLGLIKHYISQVRLKMGIFNKSL